MVPVLNFFNGNAGKATAWVCKLPSCPVPYLGEALGEADKKGVAIGIHAESRSIVVVFTDKCTAQNAKGQLETILGKGKEKGVVIDVDDIEALDLFHAESWGILTFNAPQMPEHFDIVVEEDELDSEPDDKLDSESDDKLDRESEDDEEALGSGHSSSTALEVPFLELTMPAPDIVALVQKPMTIRVPDIVDALDMDTSYQKDLRNAMEKAGGPLSEDLKKDLFPRDRQHAEDVREEARALARKKQTHAIFWLTTPPESMTVYGKPNMGIPRRIEWIRWRANKLNLELTNPMFMAIFKQVTFYSGPDTRLKQYKVVLKRWKGLDWMSLPADDRKLIFGINEGKQDCYCKNCSRVLDPKATTQFCSSSCASYFCSCGEKFEVKMVTDYEQLGRLRKRVGPYDDLLKLAMMLEHKAEVDAYQNAFDVNPKFDELTKKRKKEKCCQAIDGFVDNRWCKRCRDEFQKINYIKNCVWDISSGKVAWGHCEEAARRLKIMAEIPMPQMEEKSCDCLPTKKARTF